MAWKQPSRLAKAITGSLLAAAAICSTPATAAVVLTPVNQNIQNQPFEFCVSGNCFTFTAQGFTGFGEILGISTTGTAAVSSFFGQPSVSFTNRGTVAFGPDQFGAFSSFPATTFARFSNGDNFLGLRVTAGGEDFFGFAFTTNQTLNGIGFETAPGTTITATTDFSAAVAPVPEPATWALMLLGFAAVGASMRAKRRYTSLSVAHG